MLPVVLSYLLLFGRKIFPPKIGGLMFISFILIFQIQFLFDDVLKNIADRVFRIKAVFPVKGRIAYQFLSVDLKKCYMEMWVFLLLMKCRCPLEIFPFHLILLCYCSDMLIQITLPCFFLFQKERSKASRETFVSGCRLV